MRRAPAITGALLLAAVAGAEVPAWSSAGERLTFSLAYLRVVGGTMILENSQAGDGTVRLALRARSSPFVSRFATIDDAYDTVLDAQHLTTLSSHKKTREGRRSNDELTVFDPIAGTARRWKNGFDRGTFSARPPILDALGAVFRLRTFDLVPGKAFQLNVNSGGDTYPLIIVVDRGEKVSGPSGPVDALVVEPRFREGFLAKKEGKLTLWVTTDPTHTPVRIVSELPFGKLTATLVRIDRPWAAMVESTSEEKSQEKEPYGPQAR